ncbi:MAG: hypothetical protein ACKPKO_37330, partial [Candidatus Fonsibacter sp.]
SFTQHRTNLLSTQQLQVLERDTYRARASSRDQEVQQCLSRMSKWVDMAKAVVEAEFPDFMVVTDFSVIVVAVEEKAVAEMAVNQTHCQRLATLFGGCAGLGFSDCPTQTNSPGHQDQQEVQQSRGFAENSAKEQAGTSQTWTHPLQLVVLGVPHLVLQLLRCGSTFQHWRQVGRRTNPSIYH